MVTVIAAHDDTRAQKPDSRRNALKNAARVSAAALAESKNGQCRAEADEPEGACPRRFP
jgi:hypothetical protein